MRGEIIVLVTCASEGGALAEKIANALVSEELAACVNIIGGISSVFRWQGKVQAEKEDLLLIKSNRSLWSKLENRIKELHSYDVPEIICFAIDDGHVPYLNWLNSALITG